MSLSNLQIVTPGAPFTTFSADSSVGEGDDVRLFWVLAPYQDRPSAAQIYNETGSDDQPAIDSGFEDLPPAPGTITWGISVTESESYTLAACLLNANNGVPVGAPVYLDFSVPAAEPETPTGTTTITAVIPGVRSVTLAWDYDAADQTGFRVQLGGGAPVDVGNVTEYTVPDLAPNTEFSPGVRVIPYNGEGDGTPSDYNAFWTWAAFAGTDTFDHPNTAAGRPGPHWINGETAIIEGGLLGRDPQGAATYIWIDPALYFEADQEIRIVYEGTEGTGVLLRGSATEAGVSGYQVVVYEGSLTAEVYKVVDGIETLLDTVDTNPPATDITVGVRTIDGGSAEIYVDGYGAIIDDIDPHVGAGVAGLYLPGTPSGGDSVARFEITNFSGLPRVHSVVHAWSHQGAYPETAPHTLPPNVNLLLGSVIIEHGTSVGATRSGMSWGDDWLNALGQKRCDDMDTLQLVEPVSQSVEVCGVQHGYMHNPGTASPRSLRARLGAAGVSIDAGILIGVFVAESQGIRDLYQSPLSAWHDPEGVPYDADISGAVHRAMEGDLVVDILHVVCGAVHNDPALVAYDGQTELLSFTPLSGVTGAGFFDGVSAFGVSTRRVTAEDVDPETGLAHITMGWKFDEGAIHTGDSDSTMMYEHLIVVIASTPPPIHSLSAEPHENGAVSVQFTAAPGKPIVVVTRTSEPPPSPHHMIEAVSE